MFDPAWLIQAQKPSRHRAAESLFKPDTHHFVSLDSAGLTWTDRHVFRCPQYVKEPRMA